MRRSEHIVRGCLIVLGLAFVAWALLARAQVQGFGGSLGDAHGPPRRADFTPKDLPGIGLWLDATQGVTQASNAVSSWADESGNGNTFTSSGANEPTYVASCLNGMPCLQFDGSTPQFMSATSTVSLQPGTGGWWCAFVGKRTAAAGTGDWPPILSSRPWSAAADDGWAVSYNYNSGAGTNLVASHFADGTRGHDVGTTTSATALSSSSFQVWLVDEPLSPTNTYFRLNGALDATIDQSTNSHEPTTSVADSTDAVYIGKDKASPTREFAGKLAEIVWVKGTSTQAQREALTQYLREKWAAY